MRRRFYRQAFLLGLNGVNSVDQASEDVIQGGDSLFNYIRGIVRTPFDKLRMTPIGYI